MNHFYLTLPSDSSKRYYPENTTACFKTKLSDRIDLDGEYEVGLAQLIYPRSWYNFNNRDKSLFVSYQPYDGAEVVQVFSSSQFASEEKLTRILTDMTELTNIMFKWDSWMRKIKLVITKRKGIFS